MLPPGPPGFDWNGFCNFIRNYNNVTWRNFNVVELPSDPSVERVVLPFLIAGAPDEARVFDLEIQRKLPEDVRVWLELPIVAYVAMRKSLFREVKINKKTQLVTALLPRIRSLPLCNVRLNRSSRHKCRLIIQGSKSLSKGSHSVAIRQIFEGLEVGRVTWVLRPHAKKRLVKS
jgi:hypothetical protein